MTLLASLLILQTAAANLVATDIQRTQARATRTGWETCVINSAKRYAATNEPATAIVDTALATCANAEAKYHQVALEILLAQPGTVHSVAYNGSNYAVEEARQNIRTSAMQQVLERRLPRSKKRK